MEDVHVPCLQQKLETLSADERWATLVLFRGVENVRALRRAVRSGELQCTLLDAAMVASPFHVLVAANRAMCQELHGTVITKNVFSQTIYCMSPSTNISESFRRFAISDQSRDILVVILTKNAGDCGDQVHHLEEKVLGTAVPISQLSEVSDIDRIKKVYNITEKEGEISSLENSIVSLMN